MLVTVRKILIGAHLSLRIEGIRRRRLSRSYPLSGAKIGVVRLLIQTRSPPSLGGTAAQL